MNAPKRNDDLWLIAGIAIVWAVLAALYEFVPALRMPGSSLLWGSGALVFLVIAGAILRAPRPAAASPRGHDLKAKPAPPRLDAHVDTQQPGVDTR